MPTTFGQERTEQSAIEQANNLLLGTAPARPEAGSEVLRDAPDVETPLDTEDFSIRHIGAQMQVEANGSLEAARLAQMSPEDGARYLAVKQRCLDGHDPVAALALQKLLFEGKLPGVVDRKGEGTTLQHLGALADGSAPLADGIDRNQLVTDLVQELSTPSAINQGYRGTCGPTTIGIQLALENPAEYARIVSGLASPDGNVTLAGGLTITREAGTVTDDASGRSSVQRLVGAAFMEVANGDREYDNATDEGWGAYPSTLDLLYEQVMGRPMSDQTLATPAEQAGAMGVVDQILRAGGMMTSELQWGDGAHFVLVTGTETIDGQQYVRFINPWGREERMPRSTFEVRLLGINYDPQRQQAGQVLQTWDKLFPWLPAPQPQADPLQRQVERGRLAKITG